MNRSFKLLNEEALTKDLLTDEAHSGVADAIYKLLISDSSPASIGIEGPWGSGKSTVVNILIQKLTNNENFHVFYFDTWAHEGDPLRRVFLESLVDSFTGNDVNCKDNTPNSRGRKKSEYDIPLHELDLNGLKNVISGKTKRKEIKVNRKITVLGLLLTISTFFVPIGLGLFSSINSEQLTFAGTGQIYGQFVFALVFCCLPLLILLGNFLFLWSDSIKKVYDLNNWAFLQSSSTEDSVMEISDEDERSSIEFERFFHLILTRAFSSNDKTLILIVDNLDRVDAQDALKIWSTLQTFLQHRNPTSRTKPSSHKIWTIVPYDQKGLSSIWSVQEKYYPVSGANNTNTYSASQVAKSFFEKSFQLRVEVPLPTRTTWENFAKEQMMESFKNWNPSEIEEVYTVLRSTISNLEKNLTPREIKTFINQVGFVRTYADPSISLTAIAFYVTKRYLGRVSVQDITERLLSTTLITASDSSYLPKDIENQLSGLVFNVNKISGRQLLLETPIKNCLVNQDEIQAKQLLIDHPEAFWSVFELILNNGNDINELLCYAKVVFAISENTSATKKYIQSVRRHINITTKNTLLLPSNITMADNFIAILNNVQKFGDRQAFWKSILLKFEDRLENIEQWDPEGMVIMMYLWNNLANKNDLEVSNKNYTYAIWTNIAQTSIDRKLASYCLLKPTSDLVSKATGQLGSNNLNDMPKVITILKYILHSGVDVDWNNIVVILNKKIKTNFSSNSNNGAVIQSFKDTIELLYLISYQASNRHQSTEIKTLLNTNHFYTMVNLINDPKIFAYTVILTHYYRGIDRFKQSHINLPNRQTMNIIREFNQGGESFADILLEIADETGDYDFAYDLIKKDQYKVPRFFFEKALGKPESNAFKVADFDRVVSVSKGLMKLIPVDDDTLLKEMGQRFVEQSDVVTNLLSTIENLDLIQQEYVTALYYLFPHLDLGTQKELAKIYRGQVKNIDKIGWNKDLNERGYLIPMCLQIKPSFSINNEMYFQAIVGYFTEICTEGKSFAANWHKNAWERILKMMGKRYRVKFKKHLTEMAESREQRSEIYIITKKILDNMN